MKKWMFALAMFFCGMPTWSVSQSSTARLKFFPNPVEQGQYLSILGNRFTRESVVVINNTKIKPTYVDSTLLQLSVPKNIIANNKSNRVSALVYVVTPGKPSPLIAYGTLTIIIPNNSCSIDVLINRLGQLRTAVALFYGDTEGFYPSALSELVPKYISEIPVATICAEQQNIESSTNKVTNFDSVESADGSGGWGYINNMNSEQAGAIFINSKSKSPQGKPWYKY